MDRKEVRLACAFGVRVAALRARIASPYSHAQISNNEMIVSMSKMTANGKRRKESAWPLLRTLETFHSQTLLVLITWQSHSATILPAVTTWGEIYDGDVSPSRSRGDTRLSSRETPGETSLNCAAHRLRISNQPALQGVDSDILLSVSLSHTSTSLPNEASKEFEPGVEAVRCERFAAFWSASSPTKETDANCSGPRSRSVFRQPSPTWQNGAVMVEIVNGISLQEVR